MNYELVKKLKDAGFPQLWHVLGRQVYLNDGIKVEFEKVRYGTDEKGQQINFTTTTCIPTLSELIEACGGVYFALENYQSGWQASNIMWNDFVYGSTPEEAVANLWLQLHPNQPKV